MVKNLKVRVPNGTTEASVGTNQYTADETSHIVAPEADALTLLGVPGFTIDATDAPPEGFVRVIAPEGTSTDGTGGLSYLGISYTVGSDLTVIVPAGAVGELLSHGFTPAPVVDGVVLTDADVTPPAPPAEIPPPGA